MSFSKSIAQLAVIVQVVRTLSGLIIDTIQLAEQAIPIQGAGREKLALVKATVVAAIGKIEGLTVGIEQLWPTIEGVVNAWVAIFNKTFWKSPANVGPGPTPVPANPQS